MDALTVIIPVWGSYIRFLARSVASVADDTSISRIIVIDNASTEPLPTLPKHIEVVRLPKRVGLRDARNAGLKLVSTPLVAFLDADDEALPGGFAALVTAMIRHPSNVATVGQLKRIYDDGRTMPSPWPGRNAVWASYLGKGFNMRGFWKNSYPTCTGAVLRSAVVKDSGGFPPVSYHEDWALGILLSWQGNVKFVHQDVAKYRYADDSRLHHLSKDQLRVNRREVQSYVLSHPATPPVVRSFKGAWLWFDKILALTPPVH